MILFFKEFISMAKNYRFLKQWFYQNYCLLCALKILSARSSFFIEKNKDLPTINQKLVQTKSFDCVTYPYKLGKRSLTIC